MKVITLIPKAAVLSAPAVDEVFTTSAAGLVPESPGGTSAFLRADGAWAAPSGSGGGNLDDALAVAVLL